MADIEFKGRVAVVTGAGGGLGRQHALALAARGAKVLVEMTWVVPWMAAVARRARRERWWMRFVLRAARPWPMRPR